MFEADLGVFDSGGRPAQFGFAQGFGEFGAALAGGADLLDEGGEGPGRRGFAGGGEQAGPLVEQSLHAMDVLLHLGRVEDQHEPVERDADGFGDIGVAQIGIEQGVEDGIELVGGDGWGDHGPIVRTVFVWVKGFCLAFGWVGDILVSVNGFKARTYP